MQKAHNRKWGDSHPRSGSDEDEEGKESLLQNLSLGWS